MGILGLATLKKQVFSILGPDCESSETMLMKLLLPCLLGLLVEVWGQQYPPTQTPPYPSTQPPHQQGYAPAGYATPSTGYGGSGGYGNLLSDPTTMMLLMQQDDGLDDNVMLMASMMGNKFGGFGGFGGFGSGMNPMMLMHLMRNGGLSSNPLAMMAMMGGGKKINPFLMSKLLQCKEGHSECTQPNNARHEVCGIPEDEYHYSQSSGRLLLPCCTCKNTEETIAEMYIG